MQEIFDHPCLHNLEYLGLCRRLCQWSQVGWAWVEGLPITDHGGSETFPPAADQTINQSNQPKTSLQFHHRLRYQQARLATKNDRSFVFELSPIMNRIIVLVSEENQNHEQDSLKNIILFYLSEKEIKTLRMFHWVQLILTNFQIPITVDAIDFSRLRLKDKRFKN